MTAQEARQLATQNRMVGILLAEIREMASAGLVHAHKLGIVKVKSILRRIVTWICLRVFRMQSLVVSTGIGTNCESTFQGFVIMWTTTSIKVIVEGVKAE